jgi:hypothetical protein
MGRPSKFDAKKAEDICTLLKGGNTLKHAAAFCRVEESTVKKWIARGRKESGTAFARLADDVAHARAVFFVESTQVVRKGGKNSKDRQWLMSKLDPLRFGDRVAVHLEEGLTDILEALKAGLEPEVFERVVEILGAEAGAGPAEANPSNAAQH